MKLNNDESQSMYLLSTRQVFGDMLNNQLFRKSTGKMKVQGKRRSTAQLLKEAQEALETHLEQILERSESINPRELSTYVSAIALAKLATQPKAKTAKALTPTEEVQKQDKNYSLPAESVVDFSEPDVQIGDNATEKFLWRKELEQLWRKRITKDEFHRPVVRSLGIPVLVIVDKVREGHSWKTICSHYPGLENDDIRAAVSMATECGWLSED